MKITLSGLPGSGTTTVARLLAKELGLELISAGEMFRELASAEKLRLEQFSELAEEDEDFDRQVDERQAEEARKRAEVVVEGRLSGFFVPDADLKVWLKAPSAVRASRIAGREGEGYEAAFSAMKNRERSERERYEKYYGIILDDLSLYDLVLNSARWGERGVVAVVKVAAENVERGVGLKEE